MPPPDATRAALYGRESKDKTKSIEDQLAIGTRVIAEQGWTPAGSYDDGSSASRYATKPRPDWQRLLVDLDTGKFDVLVLWETTRGDRTLASWATLLDRCRERGVLIHVISDERTYDPRRARDYRDLATAGVDGSYESDRSAERVRRGIRAAAENGKPPGGFSAYGFRRVYTDTREPRQEADPDTAPVVRRIFDMAARYIPVVAIVRTLNAEGVPAPGGGTTWHRSRVRDLLANPAYIGLRQHGRYSRRNGVAETLYPGGWPVLVDEETYYAVRRIMADPARTTTRMPGRLVHLLSGLATCHQGHRLRGKNDGRRIRYVCDRGCVGIRADDLDELVTATVLEALADPKVYRRLRQAGERSDAEVQAARDEAARLVDQLADWRASATDGRGTTPETLAAVEADLARQIAAARARADHAGLSRRSVARSTP